MIRTQFCLVLATLTASVSLPATGQEGDIKMIDATALSVAELMALANQERDAATLVNCCDWSGGGCLPHLVRQAADGLPQSAKR